MKKCIIITIVIGICTSLQSISVNSHYSIKAEDATEWILSSPDNHLTFKLSLDQDNKKLAYGVEFKGTQTILSSPLGIDRADDQFSANLKFISKSQPLLIDEEYELKSGKRLRCRNYVNEQIFRFENSNARIIEFILRVYNDGVAFRYRFPDEVNTVHKIISEKTGFILSTSGKAWIHPYDWNSRLKPSYEQYCRSEINIGSDSPYKEQGWAFPLLFNTNDQWIMITEAELDESYCATHVKSNKDGLYTIAFAEKEEAVLNDDPEPVSILPWTTPWRVIIVGEELSAIVETNIIQSLNPPSVITDTEWIKPGRTTFSWWSDRESSSDFSEQISYINLAADLGWEYVLLDAGWHRMTEDQLDYVMQYAKDKNVGIWLWYHSGIGSTEEPSIWNLMSDPERRKAELDRIQAWGVKGVKLDFFDSDKQGVIQFNRLLLEEFTARKLMVNFHGTTLPRGIERTYPNLMAYEAVKGSEALTSQSACNRAPEHNATIPFTRNPVGSMDYAPVTFSNKIYNGVEAINVTTHGHQLALSVVFESGLQHFADNRKVYENLQEEAKNFLKRVPVAWDDTRLLDGYPGDYVVIARRKGDDWYIGCINGKNKNREINLDLSFLPNDKKIRVINDAEEKGKFSSKDEVIADNYPVNVKPYGGFVITTIDDASLHGLITDDGEAIDVEKPYLVPQNNTNSKITFTVETSPGAKVFAGGKELVDKKLIVDVSKPNIQEVVFEILSKDGNSKEEYTLHVEKRFKFDDIVITRWNNTLIANGNNATNGGFTFSKYKWFKNNKEIGTGQYYSAGTQKTDVLQGTYYLELTTKEGQTLRTWDKQIGLKNSMLMKVYPNPLKPGETVSVQLDATLDLLDKAMIEIYNIHGILLKKTKVTGNITSVSMPQQSGTYILKVYSKDFVREEKLIVN